LNTKILDATYLRHLDQLTIENQHITSNKLMERAAHAFIDACDLDLLEQQHIFIFAGMGNNGGDALVIARLLLDLSIPSVVYLCQIGTESSQDYQLNLKRLQLYADAQIYELHENDVWPVCDGLVIDGIFGSGINRPIEGYWSDLIEHINANAKHIISIDMPSGMFPDKPTKSVAIKNAEVISFDSPKLAFLLPDSQAYIKSFQIVDIGLYQEAKNKMACSNFIITNDMIQTVIKARPKFSHKGTYGKVCIVGGSKDMIGGILLAGKAALSSGCGYVYYHVPQNKKDMTLQNHPESIILAKTDDAQGMAIAIGPALGQSEVSKQLFYELMAQSMAPIVVDADALNIMANDNTHNHLPQHSILSPHQKEFERLFGSSENSFSQLKTVREEAVKRKLIICLKGPHTIVATPDGKCYFNTTGNPGMAVAGSGDVLTGIIASLLAQKLNPTDAAVSAVYLHGLAGDLAAKEKGEYGMTAQDIINYIPYAIKSIVC